MAVHPIGCSQSMTECGRETEVPGRCGAYQVGDFAQELLDGLAPLSLTYMQFKMLPRAKDCSNYRTIALISHASKVMFKILKPGFSNT